MAQRKNSLITAAERYVEKGQYKRAISAYQKLAKIEPDNIRTQLKLGELFIKTGTIGNARRVFLGTAQHYEDSGMILKAIAVYNQILQIDPGDPDTRLALATAYKRIGLANDAAFQYGIAIKGFERNKDIQKKLETIRILLELDPENLTTRVRLGEEFSKNGLIDEAAEQFQVTCDSLLEKGLVDEFAQVAERLLFHKPDAYDISKLLARYYLTKDYPQRSLPLLHNCYKKHKQDVDVMNLLAHAFQRLGQVHKAVVVLSQLAEFYGKSSLGKEKLEVEERIIALDPEHPLAKEAKANQLISPMEKPELPSMNSDALESEEEFTHVSPDVSDPERAAPMAAAALSAEDAALPGEPPEVIALATEEFTIEISEARRDPRADTIPPALPPSSLENQSSSNSVAPKSLAVEDHLPTVVFETECEEIGTPDILEPSSEERSNTENTTIEFDMSQASKTIPPSLPPVEASDPRAAVIGPIQSTIVSSNSGVHNDEIVTSDFSFSPDNFRNKLEEDGEEQEEEEEEESNLASMTLVDAQFPGLSEIVDPAEKNDEEIAAPLELSEEQRGELLEFDFFVEAGLFSEAQSVLDEIVKEHAAHREVASRIKMLREKMKEVE